MNTAFNLFTTRELLQSAGAADQRELLQSAGAADQLMMEGLVACIWEPQAEWCTMWLSANTERIVVSTKDDQRPCISVPTNEIMLVSLKNSSNFCVLSIFSLNTTIVFHTPNTEMLLDWFTHFKQLESYIACKLFELAFLSCKDSFKSELAKLKSERQASMDSLRNSLVNAASLQAPNLAATKALSLQIFGNSNLSSHAIQGYPEVKMLSPIDEDKVQIVAGESSQLFNTSQLSKFPSYPCEGNQFDDEYIDLKTKPIPIPATSRQSTLTIANVDLFEKSHNSSLPNWSDDIEATIESFSVSSTLANASYTLAQLQQKGYQFHGLQASAPLNSGRTSLGSGSICRVAGSFVDTPRSILSNPEIESMMQEHKRAAQEDFRDFKANSLDDTDGNDLDGDSDKLSCSDSDCDDRDNGLFCFEDDSARSIEISPVVEFSRSIPFLPGTADPLNIRSRMNGHPSPSASRRPSLPSPTSSRRPSWSFTAALGLSGNTPPPHQPNVNATTNATKSTWQSDQRQSPIFTGRSTVNNAGHFIGDSRINPRASPLASPLFGGDRKAIWKPPQFVLDSAYCQCVSSQSGTSNTDKVVCMSKVNCFPEYHPVRTSSVPPIRSIVPALSLSSVGLGGVCPVSIFEVFDGINGEHAANYFHRNLHKQIMNHSLSEFDLVKAIEETIFRLDKLYLEESESSSYCGTCALGVYIRNGILTMFNVGDSMAVLASDNNMIELNAPHRPNSPGELERIQRANGWITEYSSISFSCIRKLQQMDLTTYSGLKEASKILNVPVVLPMSYRIVGDRRLQVSRMLGLGDFKNLEAVPARLEFRDDIVWPEGHSKRFEGNLITCEPEIYTRDLSPKDEFLVIATRSFWNVVPPDVAVSFIRTAFAANISTVDVVKSLVEQYRIAHVSIIIVKLKQC